MELKNKLIKLFEKSCGDIKKPKVSDSYRWELQNMADERVTKMIKGQRLDNYQLFKWDATYYSYNFGFNFKDKPSLHLHTISPTFKRRYGKYLWIISYFFINNYRKRKEYLLDAKELVKTNDNLSKAFTNHDWDCGDKHVYVQGVCRYLVHGNLVVEISEKKYEELNKLYLKCVEAYDLNILNKRLDEQEN